MPPVKKEPLPTGVLTQEQVTALPGVLTPPQFGRLTHTSTSAVYDAIKSGKLPVDYIYVGSRIVIPTRPVLRMLGYDVDPPSKDEG